MTKKKIFLSLVLLLVVAGFLLIEYKLMKLFSPEPSSTQPETIDVSSSSSETDEVFVKVDAITNSPGMLNRENPLVSTPEELE